MKTPKHTPGPWTVKGEDTVVGPQGNTIAECCGYSIRATDKDQIRQGGREANATLIAAAPAMCRELETVREYLLKLYDQGNSEAGQYAASIDTTLAQAEGKP